MCRIQFIEPILDRLGTIIKLSLCLLKFSLRTFVLCFGRLKCLPGTSKLTLSRLESWFDGIEPLACGANFSDELPPFGDTVLGLCLVCMPLICVHTCAGAIAHVVS